MASKDTPRSEPTATAASEFTTLWRPGTESVMAPSVCPPSVAV